MAITTWVIRGWNSATRVIDSPGLAAPTGAWRKATVAEVRHTNPTGVVIRLQVPDRIQHLAGQHYVIRLTADDGYTAQRSYSLASAPSDPLLEFYIEALPDGEVSGFLADVVEVGDLLDIRGPIGGWFVWRGDTPAVAVAGGSGVVPIVAMLRHAVSVHTSQLLRVAVSARSWDELPYAEELSSYGALIALTRSTARTPGRPVGRLSAAELAPLVSPDATFFVCGSSSFANAASSLLQEVGVEPARIRLESFGPSGV